MTSWVEIESKTPPPEAAAATPAVAPKPATATRLRRTDQLVVGSIDAAAHVFQRRARHVVLGSAVLMVPMVALHLLLTVLAFDQYQQFDSFLGDRGYVGVETGLVLLGLVVQSLSAHLIGAYTAAYLVPYQMGGEPRVGVCLRRVVRKLPLLLLTWALTHWPTLLTMWWFATIAPTEVFGLAWIMVPVLAVISAMSLVVAPVVMIEQLGVRSIARAWRLARTRFGAAFGFVFACGLLGAMLAAFIAFLPQLAKSTGFITFGSFGWLVQGVTTQLAVLIVLPFVAIATAQMYLQLRVHAEGLDIAIAADRAFGRVAS
ncbi:MAG: hypothetical protein K8R99_11275 [Actinomycetia bacterium]|nr:hypothetical protein [Actinomycetes bacterium]